MPDVPPPPPKRRGPAPSPNSRNRAIRIRVSAAEERDIHASAACAGCTLSELVRQRLGLPAASPARS